MGMAATDVQVKLAPEQIEAFYHDHFVEAQVGDFISLVRKAEVECDHVTDIGGGVGHFAAALQREAGVRVEVVDTDPVSVEACETRGVSAKCGDALNPSFSGHEDVVTFNLILHHLIGSSESETLTIQKRALSVWRGKASAVFVNEYIYDSYVGTFSGQLIYAITSNRFLSVLGQWVSRIIPSLKANTFGVGVRFRAEKEWTDIFRSLGYTVTSATRGPEEEVSLARRLLLIKSCRRDSFLLVERD